MSLATNYGLTPSQVQPGCPTDARYTQTISRRAGSAVTTPLVAGQFVKPRDASNTDDLMVVSVSAAGDIADGVVRWEDTKMPFTDGNYGYRANDAVSVVTSGPVLLNNTGAVTRGAYAYAATNGLSVQATATGSLSRPVGIFETGNSGTGQCVVLLIPGMTAPATV